MLEMILDCGCGDVAFRRAAGLGPNLIVLYTAEVIAIAEQHGFVVHAYADDFQLYDYDDPSSCASLVSRLSACVDEIQE